jgi:chemotaxis protein CheZ
MSLTPPAGLEEDDFEAIEDAVMETARGRWFLREFGRRARAVDTSRLMESLTRIESVLAGRQPVIDAVAVDYEEHARSLEERHGRLGEIAWMLRERGYDGDICAMIE